MITIYSLKADKEDAKGKTPMSDFGSSFYCVKMGGYHGQVKRVLRLGEW